MLLRPQTALAFALLALPVGCAVGNGPGAGHTEGEGQPGEATATTSEAITSDDAISRAQQWVTAKLLYCQSANGQPDYDTSCSSTCNRESNPQWDPYRSDCSGFVSWAWGLAAPGLVTSEFAPFDTSASTTIQASDLEPGDACNLNAGGHIVLFEKWVTAGKTALFMEEPGCSANPPYAHEFQSDVTLNGVNIDIAYEGETFTAIRFNQITESPPDAGAGSSSGGTADAGSGTDAGGGTSSGSSSGSGSGSSSSGSTSGSSSDGGGSTSGSSGGGSTSSGGGSTSSSSSSSGGSTSSGSSGASSSSSGSSSGASSGTAHAGASSSGNGVGSTDATMDTNGGGMGCSVSGQAGTGTERGGAMGLGLLVVGLAFARRRPRQSRA
ncbi:MAG TPA: hypothetical protein VGG39_32850 [Polyangiaceae bacterium]|jgi:MYXO-CTERM domain-containing protein